MVELGISTESCDLNNTNWDLAVRKDVCTKTRSFAPLRMTGFELYAYFVILSEAKNLILSQSN